MNYKDELKKWFEKKLKIHLEKEINIDFRYKKWEIWYIDFWINIWNEFNKIRPAVILLNKKYSKGNNIIVAPISSFWENKKIINTNIIIEETFLKQKSIIKLNHLKDISKKRLIKKLWRVNNDILSEIDSKLKNIFDIRT